MLCPVDGETLTIAERQGVEIDYCPRCRGVWLDRGELDKILERAERLDDDDDDDDRRRRRPPAPRYDERYEDQARYGAPPYGPPPYADPRYGYPHKRKKRSFLSEMFDFD